MLFVFEQSPNNLSLGLKEYPLSSHLHGFGILNATEKGLKASQFQQSFNEGQINLEEVKKTEYVIPALSHLAVEVTHIIKHTGNNKPGNFDGWFVVEELDLKPHPLLLVPNTNVIKI